MTEKEFKIKVLPLSLLVFPMANRMLRDEEAAKDAVQLSMLKLWEKRRQLKKCENLKAFAFRVVRNTCLDEIKKKKPVYFDHSDNIISMHPWESNGYDEKEAVELVKIHITELPKKQLEVIQMKDIDGLDYPEIADVLNTDIAYIRVLLSRARKTIKQKLENDYAYEAVRQR